MIRNLNGFLAGKWYWWLLVACGLFLESVALYYQYVLGDEPCQVCIHIRVWVAAFTLLAVVMSFLPRIVLVEPIARILAIVCAVGLLERTWYLYSLENGRGDGSCEFFLDFPEWFALDRWFPFIFEVRNLCGYTPEVLFGFTMAESLLAVYAGLLMFMLAALYCYLRRG